MSSCHALITLPALTAVEDENVVEPGVAAGRTISLRAAAGSPAAKEYTNGRRRNEPQFGWLFVDFGANEKLTTPAREKLTVW
jgi:hypothetical protein